MKTKHALSVLLIDLLCAGGTAIAQENLTPVVKSPAFFRQTPALKKMPVIPTGKRKDIREVRNIMGLKKFRKPASNGSYMTTDPVRQTTGGTLLPTQESIHLNFEGMPNLSMSVPPDPHGDERHAGDGDPERHRQPERVRDQLLF